MEFPQLAQGSVSVEDLRSPVPLSFLKQTEDPGARYDSQGKSPVERK